MADRLPPGAGQDPATHASEGVRSDGFLSRWARRKQDVRQGKAVADPALPAALPERAPVLVSMDEKNANATQILEENKPFAQKNSAQAAIKNIAPDDVHNDAHALPPAPTLDDARALTPQSDFKPYMARNVTPEVKNAAMKKLFTDPRYNVMDMMDVYVDDYSKPDPIPAEMLQQMVAVKFLRLFERDEEQSPHATQAARTTETGAKPALAISTEAAVTAQAASAGGEVANTVAIQNVAESVAQLPKQPDIAHATVPVPLTPHPASPHT